MRAGANPKLQLRHDAIVMFCLRNAPNERVTVSCSQLATTSAENRNSRSGFTTLIVSL
jgi:hypothetical protein